MKISLKLISFTSLFFCLPMMQNAKAEFDLTEPYFESYEDFQKHNPELNLFDAKGPSVDVKALAPRNAPMDTTEVPVGGSFQVVLSDDQKSIKGLTLLRDNSAPVFLSSEQILASSATKPLTMLKGGSVALIMMYRDDPSLNPQSGGKINLLINQRGARNPAGIISVSKGPNGWGIEANGARFTRMSFRIVMANFFTPTIDYLRYE